MTETDTTAKDTHFTLLALVDTAAYLTTRHCPPQGGDGNGDGGREGGRGDDIDGRGRREEEKTAASTRCEGSSLCVKPPFSGDTA